MPLDDAVAAAMKRRRSLRQPDQVAAARRFVAEALARGSELRETARLLVSETVTSTLDQASSGIGGSRFEIAYAVVGGRIRVEVSYDGGPARLRRRIHGLQAESGRGLRLGADHREPMGHPGGHRRADHLVRAEPASSRRTK
jgi:hypothetical protein